MAIRCCAARAWSCGWRRATWSPTFVRSACRHLNDSSTPRERRKRHGSADESRGRDLRRLLLLRLGLAEDQLGGDLVVDDLAADDDLGDVAAGRDVVHDVE